jgi:L-threonylcarbamoyladenylate synthase
MHVLTVDATTPPPAVLERAAGVLRAGGLVAFPTETVYGLGAHALDARAV